MSVVGSLHSRMVFGRRVRVLAERLAALVPASAQTLLDIGCGDGQISRLVGDLHGKLTVTGIDVLLRPTTHIPVTPFDGTTIPFPDQSFDYAMFVDVLHHTDDPTIMLREARRVCRQGIILKDHTKDGFLAGPTLRFMDWVGNRHHGVVLPYNYWPEAKWREAFASLKLRVDEWTQDVPLYPWPGSWLFGRKLHFVARLERES